MIKRGSNKNMRAGYLTNQKNLHNSKMHGLGLHVLPFSEVKNLRIAERVRKILNLVLHNKIVIFHGRLRPEEEARLIEDTMALVDHVKGFKGVELAVIEPDIRGESIFVKMKYGLAKHLIGQNDALTVIGPASVIKEIKRDPKKLELMIG